VHKLFIAVKKELNETIFHFKLCSLWYLYTCPKNDVIFVFPKTFLCFRIGVKVRVRVRFRVEVRVSRYTFKYVFGQSSIRAIVLYVNP